MNFKTIIGAVGVVAAMALGSTSAQAVPISGQLDISGSLATSSFFGLGNAGIDVDFNPQQAFSTQIATGSFADVVTVEESIASFGSPGGPVPATAFDLFDIDFDAAAPFAIYSSEAGFAPAITFTATSFGGFDNDGTDGSRGFFANGIISVAGFDDTAGVLLVSTQELKGTATVSFSSSTVVPLPAGIVFLLTALGGLGLVARRRTIAA